MASRKAIRSRRVYIGERWWTIQHVQGLPADRDGDCNWQKRRIRVRSNLHGVALMDTLLHELLHARFWDIDESAVNEFASTAAAILDREGFRQPDDHEDE